MKTPQEQNLKEYLDGDMSLKNSILREIVEPYSALEERSSSEKIAAYNLAIAIYQFSLGENVINLDDVPKDVREKAMDLRQLVLDLKDGNQEMLRSKCRMSVPACLTLSIEDSLSFIEKFVREEIGFCRDVIRKTPNLVHAPDSRAENTQIKLPQINFDKGEVVEVIEEINMNDENLRTVSRLIDKVEELILQINKLSSKNPKDFLNSMKAMSDQIHSHAESIRKNTRSDASLGNTVKVIIKGAMNDFDVELTRQIEMPRSVSAELEKNANKLQAIQSYYAEEGSDTLRQHLRDINNILKHSNQTPTKCYICFAQPIEETRTSEHWTEKFIYILREHLRAAGIDVIEGITDCPPGGNAYDFVRENINSSDVVLLIGTRSLKVANQVNSHDILSTELAHITKRMETDIRQFGQSRVIPLLLTGTPETSFPETIGNAIRKISHSDHNSEYLVMLRLLISIFRASQLQDNENTYNQAWDQFIKNSIPNRWGKADYEKEINKGLHKISRSGLKMKMDSQKNSNMHTKGTLFQLPKPHVESIDTPTEVTPLSRPAI